MITFFYRNRNVGFSIAKVSNTITNLIEDKEIFEVPSSRAMPISIIRNLLYIRRHRNKKDINHIVGDIHYGILVLRGCLSVLTVHDTSSYDNENNVIKKIIVKYLWYVWPLKYASKIVCISQSTKKSIERFTKRSDIIVIHNAIDHHYTYYEKNFNAECPHILIVGTAYNKNIERTVNALCGLRCRVSIIGHLTETQIGLLEMNKINYCNKFNLTEKEMLEEYRQCDIVCFCSLYEGFGMPIIEANAIGRVVITSKLSSIYEVADDSVLYVDPYNIKDIHDGINLLITDVSLRNRLIHNGQNNIKRFLPENILEKYLQIYKQIKGA